MVTIQDKKENTFIFYFFGWNIVCENEITVKLFLTDKLGNMFRGIFCIILLILLNKKVNRFLGNAKLGKFKDKKTVKAYINEKKKKKKLSD